MKKKRRINLMLALLAAAGVLFLVLVTARPPAPEAPATRRAPGVGVRAEFPPGCLVAGRIDDAAGLCRDTALLLHAFDGATDAAGVRDALAMLLYHPSLAGVDLNAPIFFFGLDPRVASPPWAFAFRLTDRAAFRDALLVSGASLARETPDLIEFYKAPGVRAAVATLRLGPSGHALWYADPAAEKIGMWLADHRDGVRFRMAGRVHAAADVAALVAASGKRFEQETRRMKDRMREALERAARRGVDRAAVERDIEAAQHDLELAVAAVRQVGLAEVGFDLTAAAASLDVRLSPLPGTTLQRLAAAHEHGGAELLGQCPADALLVASHNLSIADAVRRMLGRFFGLSGGYAGGGEASRFTQPGAALYALFPAPTAGAGMNVLEIRGGPAAWESAARWSRLSESPPPADAPLTLRPRPSPTPGTLLADVALNEKALGVGAARLLRRCLGVSPRAAITVVDHRTVTVVGGDALGRLDGIRRLAAGGAVAGATLAANPAFRRTSEGLPQAPNVLFYVSPAGVADWLALADLAVGAPRPDDLGLIAVGRFSTGEGIDGTLRVPLAALRRGLEAAASRR